MVAVSCGFSLQQFPLTGISIRDRCSIPDGRIAFVTCSGSAGPALHSPLQGSPAHWRRRAALAYWDAAKAHRAAEKKKQESAFGNDGSRDAGPPDPLTRWAVLSEQPAVDYRAVCAVVQPTAQRIQDRSTGLSSSLPVSPAFARAEAIDVSSTTSTGALAPRSFCTHHRAASSRFTAAGSRGLQAGSVDVDPVAPYYRGFCLLRLVTRAFYACAIRHLACCLPWTLDETVVRGELHGFRECWLGHLGVLLLGRCAGCPQEEPVLRQC